MSVSRLSQTSVQNAFQKFNNVWDGTTAVGSMDALGVVSLGASQSSIVFSSIPQTYQHLQVRMLTRSDQAFATRSWFMFINGDTSTTTGAYHTMVGDGSTPTTSASTNQVYTQGIDVAASTASNIFSTSIVEILDYTNTNKKKTTRYIAGYDANGSGQIWVGSGFWNVTTAISTLSISANGSFVPYCSFALYGIK